jgi:hypothetical protein
MSIRDDFEALWNRGEYDVSELLDMYRHELAEWLLDEIGRPDYENEGELVKRYVAGWRAAASYLDSEA